jgi:hypothetical protein
MEEKLLNLTSDIDATVQSTLLKSVKDKYRAEKARKLRQFEFRNEVSHGSNSYAFLFISTYIRCKYCTIFNPVRDFKM